MTSLSRRAGLAALASFLVSAVLSLSSPAAHAGMTNGPGDCSAHKTVAKDKKGIALPADDSAAYRPQVVANGTQTYQWGSASWKEPAWGCRLVSQTFDFWPATGGDPNANHPTIVYFHPDAAGSHVQTSMPLYANVVLPATTAGFNFVSVEFRHPVIDQYLATSLGGQVPHIDTGLAIQYLRAHAKTLGISSNNIFAFGYSRGSLSLWQALQPDLGGGTTGKPSSHVSGFFGYQAQTTYQCDQYGQLFLDPNDVTTPEYIGNCKATNPYWQQFGSALDAVSADSPPVKLQYQQGLELRTGTQRVIQQVSAPWLVANYEVEHYPDFGIALYDAYLAHGNTHIEYPTPYVPPQQQFVGWQAFVTPLLKPDAP